MVTVTVRCDDGTTLTAYERFPGSAREPTVFLAREGWVEGWYSSPDLKVEATARQTGHGNFPVPDDRVLYESRTVTVHLTCWGGTREASVALASSWSRALAQSVTVTVDDGGLPTWARGHCQLAWESDWSPAGLRGTLTVVCDDPRRYGEFRGAYASSSPDGPGALRWADGGPRGLVFPISFGDVAEAATACSLHNAGTAAAHPVIAFTGAQTADVRIPWSASVETDWGRRDMGSGELRYQGPTGGLVVLDCLSHTASVAGVDRTRYVTGRQWPAVPAGGDLSLSLVCDSAGYIEAHIDDTYI